MLEGAGEIMDEVHLKILGRASVEESQ
jgi:hypothetical protein